MRLLVNDIEDKIFWKLLMLLSLCRLIYKAKPYLAGETKTFLVIEQILTFGREISQLQELPGIMNEFFSLTRKCLMQFLCRFSSETIFCFSFRIFVLIYHPVSIPFSSNIWEIWRQIPKKKSMYKRALCLKVLLKIPPSWSQPCAARSANQKWVIFPFIQSGSSNFDRGNYQN